MFSKSLAMGFLFSFFFFFLFPPHFAFLHSAVDSIDQKGGMDLHTLGAR
jgi:hypothetical protein